MRALTLICLIASTLDANCREWYVDVNATGAGNGTNWANAWADPTNINWTSTGVAAGDTVWISGGEYGTPGVDRAIYINRSGTESAPILIKTSQESGHDGKVTIYGHFFSGQSYWTLDGRRWDDYQYSSITNTLQVRNVTNLCNLWVIGANPINLSSASAGIQGVTVKGVEMTANRLIEDCQNYHGFRMFDTYVYTNIVVEYCWVHDVCGDGFTHQGGTNPYMDLVTVRFCYLQNIGDDGFEVSGGWTIHNCEIGPSLKRDRDPHPDGLSGTATRIRFFNNIVHDFHERYFYPVKWSGDTHDLYFYGNLLYRTTYTNYPQLIQDGAVSIAHEDINYISTKTYLPGTMAADGTNVFVALTTVPLATPPPNPTYWARQYSNRWYNVVIANNTIIADTNDGPSHLARPIQMVNRYGYACSLVLSNWVWKNNLFLNGYSKGVQAQGAGLGYNDGWTYDTNSFTFDYNDTWSPAAGGMKVTYKGVEYTDAAGLAAGTGFTHNKSAEVKFADPSSYSFALAQTDTTARDAGTDLSALGLTGWNIDLAGNSRTADAYPDMGALEYTAPDNNLLLQLTFDEDFTFTNCIADTSGHGNHAWRFGRAAYPTNFPARVLSSTTPGGPPNGYCGEFRWWQDGYGLLGKSGSYAGVTNVAAFTNLSRASIMCWARYYPAPGNGYDADQNAHMLSAGYTQNGSWGLGRWYSTEHGGATSFNVMTNIAGYERDLRVKFPDANWADGDTARWHHYAVTFDGGNVHAYFDGVEFTNVAMAVPALTVGTYVGGGTARTWIGVGCQTHDGTPWMDDEFADGSVANDYPNHGWFNGVMDDVRIYNVALSAADIASIAGVTMVGPTILIHPQDAERRVGDPVTFSVSVNGTTPMSYQWLKDWVPISGETNATLTFAAVTAADGGDYAVTLTNAYGTATSLSGTLTVTDSGSGSSTQTGRSVLSGSGVARGSGRVFGY